MIGPLLTDISRQKGTLKMPTSMCDIFCTHFCLLETNMKRGIGDLQLQSLFPSSFSPFWIRKTCCLVSLDFGRHLPTCRRNWQPEKTEKITMRMKVKLQLHVCLDKGTTLLLQCKKNGITLSDILLEFLKVRIPYLKVLRRGLSTPEPPSIHPPLRWKFAVSSLSQVTKIRPDRSLFPFCNCSKGREPCTPFFFP